MITRSLLVSFVLCLAAAGPAGAQTPEFLVEDLGVLPGSYACISASINARGHVVGHCSMADASVQSWRWTPERGLEALPPSPPWERAVATGINNEGVISGYVQTLTGDSTIPHIARYTYATGWQILDPGGSTDGGDGLAINDRGEIVGSLYSPGAFMPHGFSWSEQSGIVDLTPGWGALGQASDINEEGEVIGYSSLSLFRWKGGVRDRLGVPAGWAHASAGGINLSGQVAGRTSSASGNSSRVIRYTDGVGFELIPGCSGEYCSGSKVNARGTLIGSGWQGKESPSPLIYRDGIGTRGVDDLIDHSTGWHVWHVSDINDSGVIAADGSRDFGNARPIRLVPVGGIPALVAASVRPVRTAGGNEVTGYVVLRDPAPAGGASVALQSSDPAHVSVPPSVVVPAGAWHEAYTITTHPVGATTPVTITARYSGATQTAKLELRAPRIRRVETAPLKVEGGSPATGRVFLTGPAYPGDIVVALTSSDPSAAVPPSVTVPAGEASALFAIDTLAVTLARDVTITAVYADSSATAVLPVLPQLVYRIEDLGTLPERQRSWGRAISSSGNVVGEAEGSVFLFTADAQRFDLGEGRGEDVNDAGQLAGHRKTGPFAFDPSVATRYNEGAGWVDLGTLGGAGSSYAYGINAAGEVCGSAATTDGEHAFVWTEAGGMQDLGVLGSGHWSAAHAISDAGTVVGESETAYGGWRRAFRWTAATGLQDLGTLGGPASQAIDVTDAGVVVGASENASYAWRAFRWTAASAMQDLGTLPSHTSCGATAVNLNGDIVGSCSGATTDRAFRWTADGGIEDLNLLVDTTLGWSLREATGINDAGQITGWGFNAAGETRAFRLSLPEDDAPGCTAPVPAHRPTLRLVEEDLGSTMLEWTGHTDAISYDVVRGDLGTLRRTLGDFTTVEECLADNMPGLSLRHWGTPAVGSGSWYLVQPVGCAGPGSFDEANQTGSRDPEVAAAPAACP